MRFTCVFNVSYGINDITPSKVKVDVMKIQNGLGMALNKFIMSHYINKKPQAMRHVVISAWVDELLSQSEDGHL